MQAPFSIKWREAEAAHDQPEPGAPSSPRRSAVQAQATAGERRDRCRRTLLRQRHDPSMVAVRLGTDHLPIYQGEQLAALGDALLAG